MRVLGFFHHRRLFSRGARHGALPLWRYLAGRIVARTQNFAKRVLIAEEVVERSGMASPRTHKLGRSLRLLHKPLELSHVVARGVGEAKRGMSSWQTWRGQRGPIRVPSDSCWVTFQQREEHYVHVFCGQVRTEQELNSPGKRLGVVLTQKSIDWILTLHVR